MSGPSDDHSAEPRPSNPAGCGPTPQGQPPRSNVRSVTSSRPDAAPSLDCPAPIQRGSVSGWWKDFPDAPVMAPLLMAGSSSQRRLHGQDFLGAIRQREALARSGRRGAGACRLICLRKSVRIWDRSTRTLTTLHILQPVSPPASSASPSTPISIRSPPHTLTAAAVLHRAPRSNPVEVQSAGRRGSEIAAGRF